METFCLPADVGELTTLEDGPAALALVNAELKALAVAPQRRDEVVLGADTIVVLGGEVFGKPRDYEHAAEMLGRLAGRTHEVITGVCLVRWEPRLLVKFTEATRVRFRPLGPDEIAAYLRTVHPLDKAGGYAAQEDEGRLIECVEGSFTNVVGLPVERVVRALERHFSN